VIVNLQEPDFRFFQLNNETFFFFFSLYCRRENTASVNTLRSSAFHFPSKKKSFSSDFLEGALPWRRRFLFFIIELIRPISLKWNTLKLVLKKTFFFSFREGARAENIPRHKFNVFVRSPWTPNTFVNWYHRKNVPPTGKLSSLHSSHRPPLGFCHIWNKMKIKNELTPSDLCYP